MKRTIWIGISIALLVIGAACHKRSDQAKEPLAEAASPGPGVLVGAAADEASAPMPGVLRGTVMDESSKPIVGAEVMVEGTSLMGPRGAETDAGGRFEIPLLPPASDYSIATEAMGYGKVIQSNVSVEVGSTTEIRVSLSSGEELSIIGSAPVVDTRKTSVGAVISDSMINAIPLDRDSSNIAFLAPTSTPSSLGGNPSVVSASGPENVFMLNGVSTAGPSVGGAEAPPNVEQHLETADEVYIWEDEETLEYESAEDVPATQGALRVQGPDGEFLGEFPLQRTEVEASISGIVARTEIRQEYGNPFDEVIEAVYVYPLGTAMAVNDFVMEVAGRKIVGVVRPREEAEEIYQEAREMGLTASLLTQERPNVFTQKVANIEPGGSVTVTVTTFERLPVDRGTYEYVFPMVVGPRYIPGSPSPVSEEEFAQAGGAGRSAPTDIVPDAHRITPPVLEPGRRSGHDISLQVQLDAGFPLGEVRCVAHDVAVDRTGPSRCTVTLSETDSIPNKDFVLRWTTEGDGLQMGLLAHRTEEDGYFSLLVQPPLQPADEEVMLREVTFLLDVSGSMGGIPVETSKDLVRKVLGGLRPSDMFNIYFFESGNGRLWEEARLNTPGNLEEATAFLNSLSGGGGTEMLAGLKRALEGNHDPQYLQMFVFCTDGFIGDEERILSMVRRERGDARFFAFGIGDDVNRYLIEGIARLGAGKSMVVMPSGKGQADLAADRFFELIDAPVLVDVAIDWNGLPVKDIYPEKPEDLFSGGIVSLVGKYTGPATGTAYITGRLGDREMRFPFEVNLPASAPRSGELVPLWAHRRISDLSDRLMAIEETADREPLVAAITDLGVKHRIVTAFTSFVAVDESRVVGDGRPSKVTQPLEIPNGVGYEGVFVEPGFGSPAGRRR